MESSSQIICVHYHIFYNFIIFMYCLRVPIKFLWSSSTSFAINFYKFHPPSSQQHTRSSSNNKLGGIGYRDSKSLIISLFSSFLMLCLRVSFQIFFSLPLPLIFTDFCHLIHLPHKSILACPNMLMHLIINTHYCYLIMDDMIAHLCNIFISITLIFHVIAYLPTLYAIQQNLVLYLSNKTSFLFKF